jgi:hypothetical protein
VAADVDADAVAAAVLACPSVVRLVGGRLGDQVATYLPGRRVHGIRVAEDGLHVHIASLWGVPIPAVAAEVRAAVAPLAFGLPVHVSVDDVDGPAHELPSAEPKGAIDAGDPPTAMPSPP